MHPEDQEILDLIHLKNNRNEAFKLLVFKYQRRIYMIVRRIAIDHDDTNDIVQEVFVKIWRKIHAFRGESKLFTWLYRIAVNEALNFIQKKKRSNAYRLNDYESFLASRIDAGFHFTSDEIEQKLQKAILKLPAKQRVVFNLRYYDELPYEEMSGILGTSVGALKASYHHAAAKIESYFLSND